ncbi:putative Esterase precursor [Hibiscus syriacus]|uniref:Esterase n=1 Tax=Hibiscus syriacus TaxID=106335 RepID=A0A6A3AJW7_HIBSY|nr:uncharacterized protein LOC120126283 [Hibiscus syriacus]KAE8704396.1 putative Esterase precursor [Hibiscus syriacus]
MNGYREHNSCCYFHPKQFVIGVCPLCLNERLLILASNRAQRSSSSTRGTHRFIRGASLKKPPINLPKIFALGSLLNRLELKHLESQHSDASPNQEDSFISIKFEKNGFGSWEKGTVSKVSLEHCNMLSCNPILTKETNKSVTEHAKPRASLMWQKRIDHLVQLIRWKRSRKVEG